jgi:hypothetical protein
MYEEGEEAWEEKDKEIKRKKVCISTKFERSISERGFC